jgi:hypothetical protein
MCYPVLIQAVAAVGAAYSSNEQGKFQEGTANYNARQQENEAQQTVNQGTERENIVRQEAAELKSRQRAQLANQGIDINSGSALSLQEDTDLQAETDSLRIRSGFERQGQSLLDQSTLTTAQGANARAAGKQGAVGSLLSSAGKVAGSGVADKWFTPKSTGKTT